MTKHTVYTKEVLQEAVDNSTSVMGVLEYLGRPKAGGTHAHVSRRIKFFEIDTTHFTGQGHNKGKPSFNRRTAEEILVVLPTGSQRPRRPQLKRAMLESGIPEVCGIAECAVGVEWLGRSLTLDIDHIDGNWLNNKLDNLRFLCQNCHHQQITTNLPWKYRKKP